MYGRCVVTVLVVSLTDEEKKVYGTFFKLRRKIPNVMIRLLRQISVYIGKSIDNLELVDVYNINEDNYEILLNDGRKIIFSSGRFEFTIMKEENNFFMKVIVCDDINGNLLIDGLVQSDDNLKYLISSDNTGELLGGRIDCYNELDSMIDSSSFEIIPEIDSCFDCYDGCLGTFLSRIDLLYDNTKCVINSYKVRKKKVS